MTLSSHITRKIIKKLLKGKDYRIEIVTLINTEFLQFAIDFFKKIAVAKLESLDIEWIELRSDEGYKKFKSILDRLKIPSCKLDETNIDRKIEAILKEIFT